MTTRTRKANWSEAECLLLAESVLERKDVIKGKCKSRVSLQHRKQAWEEVVKTINAAFPESQHTVSDCSKKWENLVTKTREEIRQHINKTEDKVMSLEKFSAVTQIVISVTNLSCLLQQGTRKTAFEPNGVDHMTTGKKANKHLLPEPSSAGATPIATFRVTSSPPHALVVTDSGEHLDASCSTSQQEDLSRTLQARMDLELSVLKRQEAVLKLQEEYYTMKIQMMKNQMGQSFEKE